MHKRRQRQLHGGLAVLLVGSSLAIGAACSQAVQNDARSAATAIASAQATIQPLGTVLAGAQATVQPLATLVGVSAPNLDPTNVGNLIGTVIGANVQITLEPQGVPNDRVTRAVLEGTDRSGAFGRLDPQARRSFAGAGLQLARQNYPNAQIEMVIVDQSGDRLLAVSYPANGQPAFQ